MNLARNRPTNPRVSTGARRGLGWRVLRPRASVWLRIAVLCSLVCVGSGKRGLAETLTLEDCLRETAANNPDIISEQIAIQGALGERLVLRARALPTLSAAVLLGYQGAQSSEILSSPGLGPNGKPLPQVVSPRDSTDILLTSGELSQPIFDVAIPASWRLARLGVEVARQNFYAVCTVQLARARASFIRALYYQQRNALLQQTDRILQGNLQAQNALIAAGLGTRRDVLSAQVQRANFGPVINDSNGADRNSIAELLLAMGRHLPPGKSSPDALAGIHLTGTLDTSAIDFAPAAATREALEHRPDLEALRETMRTYTENANIARGGYYPVLKIYLAGQYLPQTYIESQNASTRASDRLETTELRPGVRGNWTVIDTGAIRGQVQGFTSTRAVLGEQLRKLELAVPADLATLRGQVDAASEGLKVLQANVATAQDTLNIIQAGVAQGVNSQLEFLDAQNGVFSTQLGLLEAERTLSEAHAEFDRITGRYLRYVPGSRPDHPASSKK
jgi:outer membrane protein TolC